MPTGNSPVRAAAIGLLDGVLGERRLLSELAAETGFRALPPPARAAAQRLAADTLRALERADRVLDRHLRKRPALHLRNILRLGTVEICTGGDAFGIVDELVGLAPAHGGGRGLVNAVLRKVAAEDVRRWRDLRIPRLPGWLRAPLLAAWGKGAVAAIEAAHFAGAPLDLTARGSAEEIAARLGGRLLPTGSLRLADPGQVSELPGYEAGAWWVQDAAAALPARILGVRPGERVLDMCAAPGGKTLQLAAAGGDVVALDRSDARMARLRENLARTGLAATCVVADALAHEGGPYEAVLLDAPCSATGTIRRHPDLPFAKDGSDFAGLIELQGRMIDHALGLLEPGGRLMFCTCSLLPDEGEVQIESALARHPGLRVDREALLRPGVEPGWITEEGGLRLRPDYWPELGGMDGFYMALLRKPGSA